MVTWRDGEKSTSSWSAAVTPATPGWVGVPDANSSAGAPGWIDLRLTELQRPWSSAWSSEELATVREILGAAQVARDDVTILDLLYWPSPKPAFAKVTVRVQPSLAPSSWDEAGFRVTRYDGADIGPGLQCVDVVDVAQDDDAITIVHAHYVFDDGEVSVIVTVAPTPLEVFNHMMPSLHNLIGEMEIMQPDGHRFVSTAADLPGGSDEDAWRLTDDG